MSVNPFIVQRPIKYGEPFCNRKGEMAQLESAAKRSEAICILSIRRFGKTSLINQVAGHLEDQGWITVRLDLSRSFSVASLVKEFETALLAIKGRWERLIGHLKSVSTIRPQLSMDPMTSQPSLSFDFSRPRDEMNALRHVLEAVVSFPEKTGGDETRLCLVLDEFQNIRKIDPKGRLEWIFRSVFQERSQRFVPFLLGSEKHLLRLMVQEESSAFFKGVTPMELDVLPEDEVVDFVTSQFQRGLKLKMPESRIRGVYRIFGGHPFAINWFWAEMWSLEERSKYLEPIETYVQVAVRIILNQRDYYEAINSKLPLGARKVLLAIAEHEPVAKVFSKDFMVNACGMSQGSLQSALKVLIEEDKIKKTSRGYIVNDPLERLALAVADLDEDELKVFVKARIEQEE